MFAEVCQIFSVTHKTNAVCCSLFLCLFFKKNNFWFRGSTSCSSCIRHMPHMVHDFRVLVSWVKKCSSLFRLHSSHRMAVSIDLEYLALFEFSRSPMCEQFCNAKQHNSSLRSVALFDWDSLTIFRSLFFCYFCFVLFWWVLLLLLLNFCINLILHRSIFI